MPERHNAGEPDPAVDALNLLSKAQKSRSEAFEDVAFNLLEHESSLVRAEAIYYLGLSISSLRFRPILESLFHRPELTDEELRSVILAWSRYRARSMSVVDLDILSKYVLEGNNPRGVREGALIAMFIVRDGVSAGAMKPLRKLFRAGTIDDTEISEWVETFMTDISPTS